MQEVVGAFLLSSSPSKGMSCFSWEQHISLASLSLEALICFPTVALQPQWHVMDISPLPLIPREKLVGNLPGSPGWKGLGQRVASSFVFLYGASKSDGFGVSGGQFPWQHPSCVTSLLGSVTTVLI